MNTARDRELMQLHDGELSVQAARAVEAVVAQDPAARGVLDGLEQLGDVVRAVALDRAANVDLTDEILARIEGAGAMARPLSVVRGGAPSERPVPSRVGVVGAAMAALAVAAAVALFFASRPPTPAPAATAGASAAAPRLAARPSAPRPAAPMPAVAPAAFIEAVDFGASNGTIFVVSGAEEDDTPVVWVTDEPTAL